MAGTWTFEVKWISHMLGHSQGHFTIALPKVTRESVTHPCKILYNNQDYKLMYYMDLDLFPLALTTLYS